jgi:hypothetical protein
MNSFEQLTLVIGGLAILFEALKHIKQKLKEWRAEHQY